MLEEAGLVLPVGNECPVFCLSCNVDNDDRLVRAKSPVVDEELVSPLGFLEVLLEQLLQILRGSFWWSFWDFSGLGRSSLRADSKEGIIAVVAIAVVWLVRCSSLFLVAGVVVGRCGVAVRPCSSCRDRSDELRRRCYQSREILWFACWDGGALVPGSPDLLVGGFVVSFSRNATKIQGGAL